jgi:uncharacterized protein (UPF0332 family)
MKAETADYLAKACATLVDAHRIAAVPLPHIAAREAYVAVFHAADAYIFEQTDKAAKSHHGVHTEFARLARAEPRIGRDLVTAYQFKQRADYAIGPAAAPITSAEAASALTDAAHFVETITKVLPPGLTPPGPSAPALVPGIIVR